MNDQENRWKLLHCLSRWRRKLRENWAICWSRRVMTVFGGILMFRNLKVNLGLAGVLVITWWSILPMVRSWRGVENTTETQHLRSQEVTLWECWNKIILFSSNTTLLDIDIPWINTDFWSLTFRSDFWSFDVYTHSSPCLLRIIIWDRFVKALII